MYSKQETLNIVTRGLAAQGWRRATHSGACVYLAPNGYKCAAGQLVTHYDAKLEHFGPIDGVPDDLLKSTGLMEHDSDLVFELQNAHDGADDPESVRYRIRKVAEKHHLQFKPF